MRLKVPQMKWEKYIKFSLFSPFVARKMGFVGVWITLFGVGVFGCNCFVVVFRQEFDVSRFSVHILKTFLGVFRLCVHPLVFLKRCGHSL